MNAKERREQLFQHLTNVLSLAQKKYNLKNGQSDGRKLAWGRLIIQAVSAYGKLLETEDLEQRIIELETKLKDGVLIPNGRNKGNKKN